ncbi:MAG: AAA family ATPase [Alphaproteobacteria bacterium CG11_big_fil_rev_8_21_14_0_20_44_7]|nr:MAG: AAA family ATPase [Alphaproteobacteria bacterium CG11_big_fil_rev_8_21_14_0_20_44_7]
MKPLAERLRPETFDDYIGQEHLIAEGAVLREAIKSEQIPSFILWGPPGVGKTSLAKLISNYLDCDFYALSAINSGVKDIRETIEKAQNQTTSLLSKGSRPVLFIDEIHRFSKSQQDSLLKAVEEGIITLIGATTENPSFEVISALLSRCQVYVLEPLSKDQLVKLVDEALKNDEFLRAKKIKIKDYEAMIQLSGGDARRLYNILELVANNYNGKDELVVTNELVKKISQNNIAIYDKDGEQHYDIISAFIKSIRGSDPNGAVYWLARMIHGGEDVKFIARRIIISAAEDIGLANPNALLIAQTAFDCATTVGLPEARIILSEAAIYLANSAKSNSAYLAIDEALAVVKKTGDLPVPLHLRNAPTKLMKELSYGENYKYSHDGEHNFSEQEYLPKELEGKKLFQPQDNPLETKSKERLKSLWQKKYGY